MRPEDMPRLDLEPSQVAIIVEIPEFDATHGVGGVFVANRDETSRKGAAKDAIIVVDGVKYPLVDVLERAGIA